ncbi:hypothetical protein GWN26_05330, partial [Candidatus Saccharibacteria bacterium]|nr:hypothetical protein [Candidatus Saccharibacteria bacterium]NIV03566.1 hypothetical protein [Calditrichia bacterium]NIV71839.1 hypothetical protein [Calditrichia bacterium]NIV98586.1 hypothetical protein [Candidatus Saccharibacteria bacterium]NIW78836.1 hypothetical protein [Calditrichia bacterium]
MSSYDNRSFLIYTYNSGFYLLDNNAFKPFATPADSYLKRCGIYTAAALANGLMAVGTQFGGLAIVDRRGNLYKVIDKASGLQDNSVWAVYPDRQGGIWLALNKGISRVEFPAPLTRFSKHSGLDGNIITVQRHQGTVYVATSEGIRYLDYKNYLENDASRPLKNSRDGYKGRRPVFKPVGDLNLFGLCFLSSGSDLFAGTTSGIFRISGDQLQKVPENFTGSWHTVFALRQSKTDPDLVYVASRQGIGLLKRSQGNWHSQGWVKDLSNKIFDIVEDQNGSLWLLTIESEIIRVQNISQSPVDGWKFPANISRFDTTHGLPDETVTPLIIGKQLLFHGAQETWLFDEKRQRFHRDTTFRWAKVQDAYLRFNGRLDNSGLLWITVKDKNGEEFAAFGTPNANQTFQWNLRPFRRVQDIITINSIFPESSNDGQGSIAWIASENVFRYDSRIFKTYDFNYPALIRRIVIANDSVIFNGHDDIPTPVVAHKLNTIHFEYAATSFDAESENQFRTMLEGFDKNWSAWSKETYRNYTNLPRGDYRFLVQAKNVYGHLSDEARFEITVLPPWYMNSWMYGFYALFVGMLIFGLVKYRVRQLERKSKDLEKIVA